MEQLFYVGCGGFLGAILRYLVSSWCQKNLGASFPWGTFFVNILGCFLIGFLMGFALTKEKNILNPNFQLFLTTGFLGAFTTFSTFSYETLVLIREDRLEWALLNIALNMLIGLGAVFLGSGIAKHLVSY